MTRAATLILILGLLLLGPESAQAYIDPQSGSLVLQMLLAGFLGAAFVLRSSWTKIRAGLHRVWQVLFGR